MNEMVWTRTPWGWQTIHGDARWAIRRAPSFRDPRFWVYRASPPESGGHRYTPTGRFEDAVGFTTAREAKAFIRRLAVSPATTQGRTP